MPRFNPRLLSVLQPRASLLAYERLRIEVRPWKTPYRGRVAIFAPAQRIDLEGQKLLRLFRFPLENCVLGAIVALADLTEIQPIQRGLDGQFFCDFGDGRYSPLALERRAGWRTDRYAWRLRKIVRIEPVPLAALNGQKIPPQGIQSLPLLPLPENELLLLERGDSKN